VEKRRKGERNGVTMGQGGILLGDIKLLFRSTLYDRRSVVTVALALILRFQVENEAKKKKKKKKKKKRKE